MSHQLPYDLILAFEHYETVQETHLKSFDIMKHPDVGKQNFERSRAFEELKNQLTIMLNEIKMKENNASQNAFICRSRLSLIMEKDDVLAERLKVYRNKLKQYLKQLRQGKNALSGYEHCSTTSSPKFVSQSS